MGLQEVIEAGDSWWWRYLRLSEEIASGYVERGSVRRSRESEWVNSTQSDLQQSDPVVASSDSSIAVRLDHLHPPLTTCHHQDAAGVSEAADD